MTRNRKSADRVIEILQEYPRTQLVKSPSPIDRLDNLQSSLNQSHNIFMKRDDRIMPFFGNKVRYLEYVLGEYDSGEYDCIVHCGSLTSNYMAQLALIGAKRNIPVHIILNDKKPNHPSGNSLLIDLSGTNIYFPTTTKQSCSDLREYIKQKLQDQGQTPLVIEYPFSNYSAYLGYMQGYMEIRSQLESKSFETINSVADLDYIYTCSNWHTYLGLKCGATIAGDSVTIRAFTPSKWGNLGISQLAETRCDFVNDKVKEFSEFLDIPLEMQNHHLSEEFAEPEYGVPSESSRQAVRRMLEAEGVLLDPIYTGKALAGMISDIREKNVSPNSNIMFLHTGGWVNTFTMGSEFSFQNTTTLSI